MANDPIDDAVRRQMAKRMDDLIMQTLTGPLYTNAVAEEMPPLDIAKMLPEWDKMLRNIRRDQITFVVDVAHEGPMLMHETPADGKRVELSWHQALYLHTFWPIKLSKVNSPEQAEFVPASGWPGELIGLHPEPPPWRMPEDDDLQKSG